KMYSFSHFALNTYELLNQKINLVLINFFSALLIITEIFIPLTILLAGKTSIWNMTILLFIYFFFTIFVIILIFMGKKNQECNCFGKNIKSNINWLKVSSNILNVIFISFSFTFEITLHVWHVIIVSLILVIYIYIKIIIINRKDR
ncbi:MauE/DoxX family redox-associated membrane protein, partial [Staphylococcus pasteuri]